MKKADLHGSGGSVFQGEVITGIKTKTEPA